MITISIIVPMYNVAAYLVRCLDSIARQTYKGDVECIIVDDGSTDNSVEIGQKYIEKYVGNIRFQLIRCEKNGGQSAARNVGTRLAVNDYLLYVDSDDVIPEKSIEVLVHEVEKHPGIDIVMGFMDDERKCEYYNLNVYKNNSYVSDNRWLQYNLFCCGKNIPINPVNKLLRRGFILDNSLSFKEGIIHEDDHWMFYVMKSVRSWAFVFEPTYYRYYNEGTTTTASNKEKEEINWIKIMLDHSAHFYEPFYKLQLARYMDRYFGQWMFLSRRPGSERLHLNFFKCCCKQRLWKGAFLLVLWRAFFVVCDGFWAKKWLMQYSRALFIKESNLWKAMYGV